MEARSWLCPTELDCVRVVEANERVRRARTVAAGAVGIALVATAPWLGWWTLGLFALAVVNLATLEWRLRRSERPERVAAGSLLFILALLSTGVALSGGPESPVLAWLVIPCAMAATRFRRQVIFAFALLTAAVTIAVTVGVDPAAAAEQPVAVARHPGLDRQHHRGLLGAARGRAQASRRRRPGSAHRPAQSPGAGKPRHRARAPGRV